MESLPLAPDGTLDTSSSVVLSQEATDAARDVVGRVLQILFGVLGVQFSHDLGHIVAAKFHNVKISTPYFLPSLQIGLFGSITNFLSYPKTRKALFDVAIAGPTLGTISATLSTPSATPSATPSLSLLIQKPPSAYASLICNNQHLPRLPHPDNFFSYDYSRFSYGSRSDLLWFSSHSICRS